MRARDAAATLEGMLANGEYDPTGNGARWNNAADWAGANWLRSNNGQKFDANAKNFITAVLRKESGATITPSEIETAKGMYIPQPGDGAAVLEQKKRNRDLAIRALESQAGPNGIPPTNLPPSASSSTVRLPTGQIIQFPSAEAAAAYRRKNGL